MVSPISRRIHGYDLARALAVFGMVVVNYEVVLGAGRAGSAWLVWLVSLLEGRAAAMFVVLAGVGMSLLVQGPRLSHDIQKLAHIRRTLWKRALLLFVVGLLYSPLWPADILHFYALYILIGSFMLTWPDRGLWASAGFFVGGFVLLLLIFDYESGWNWDTLEYAGFWTPAGMARRLVFNGFHPVFPWTAFLIAGLWLGRRDLTNARARRQILIGSAAVWAIAESVSWWLVRWASASSTGIDAELAAALFGTAPLPPTPLYLFASGGAAFTVIAMCVEITERYRNARWLQPFVATGQLALTLYVAHVVIGMGALESMGMLKPQSLVFAVTSAVTFYAAGVIFAALWTRRFQRGPLEWIIRRLT